MTSSTITIETTVRPDGTLETSGLPALPPGKVRVTIEPVPIAPRRDLLEVLEEIRRSQEARGYLGRTIEELERDEREQEAEDEAYEAKWREIHSRTLHPQPEEFGR